MSHGADAQTHVPAGDGCPHRLPFRSRLIAVLLFVAGASGFMGLQTERDAARQLEAQATAVRPSVPPGTVEIDGVRYRPIETYDVCDRVLGENPLVTDEERAAFGPEPDPATWKLLRVLAPKVDGGTAKVTMVQPPEWLAEHRPEVGKTVPIWVPECGIEGMAEVLSIGPCPPVKPGTGRVVLATFEHEVSSTVDVYVTGLAEPIGCTGNHPFWSEDRQDFVRADELKPGEHLSALGADAHVERIEIDATPKLVCNIQVQGEHVYRVGANGILVHNSDPYDRELFWSLEKAFRERESDLADGLSVWRTASRADVEFLQETRTVVDGRNPKKDVLRAFTREELEKAGLQLPETASDHALSQRLRHHSLRPKEAVEKGALTIDALRQTIERASRAATKYKLKLRDLLCP